RHRLSAQRACRADCVRETPLMAETTHATVLAELRRYGLKPSVEPTGGGHQKIMWTLPGTTIRRSYVTPSEHGTEDPRARLNARAEVRRMIRADGVLDPTIEHAAKPLTKQVIEERRFSDPLPLQVAEMRAQLDELTEVVLSMALDVSATRNMV